MCTVLPATVPDPSPLAVAGFLARYREPTASAYRRDLRCFWQWCADRDLSPLTVKRPHIELYLRDLERRGYAPATISRRLSTSPACSRTPSSTGTAPPHALVAMLGMLGLRVSEVCHAGIEDLRCSGGYELRRVVGKGAKPAEIPLPIPVLRAVKDATDGRVGGPIPVSARGTALSRGAASRLLARVVRAAAVTSPTSPHTLRRTFCTAGLISGVPLRDTQYAMRPADARTTIRYDMARANLDRHAAHSVAAYLAGMAVG